MKKALIWIILLLNGIAAFSQDATTLFNQAKEALDRQDYQTAISKYEQAAQAFKQQGETENYLISSVNELDLLVKIGNINNAAPLADKLYPDIVKYNDNPNIQAHFYSLYGRIKYINGNFSDALLYYNKALQINKTIGTNKTRNAFIYSDMSLVYSALSQLDSAIFYNKKAIELIQLNEGKNSPNLIYPMINLSNIYIVQGKFDKAIDLKKNVLDITLNYFGKESEETGEAYAGLGELYVQTGEYFVAKEYLLKAMEIFKNKFGENSYKLVPVYVNLGNLYYNLGNYDYSLQYYFLATKVTKATNQNNINLPALYNNIALVCKNQNNYENAEIYYNKAYELYKSQGKESSISSAIVLTNLGNIYMLEGKYEQAKNALAKALDLNSKFFSSHNASNALTYLNIAQVYTNQNKSDSALIYLVKSIDANYKHRSYTSLEQELYLDDYYNGIYLLEAIINIIYAYQVKFESDSSIEYLHKANYFINKADTLVSELRKNFLSEQDKIQLNAKVARFYQYAVNACYWDYGFGILPKNEAFAKMFYFIERNKSTTLLEAINAEKVTLNAQIPDSLRIKEKKIKQDINYFKQKISEAQTLQEQSYYRERYIDAQNRFKQLTDLYKKEYPEYFNAKFDVEISTISDIQNDIDDSTAVLNFFMTENNLFTLIITKNSKYVEVKKFGEKDQLAIKNLNLSILSPDANNIKKYLLLGYKVYKKVMPDSIPSFIKKIIIIPDDILSTISFESLLTDSVKYSRDLNFEKLPYLINRYTVIYNYSATLLHQIKNKSLNYTGKQKFLFALAPVFGPNNPQEYNNNSVSTLPGTKEEIQKIAELCSQYNLDFDTLTNKKANEYLFKKYINKYNYKILHIATHGFVNFENPNLSALTFSKDPGNIEDGLLYSGEIYSLKIPSELVVLSACETARGKISKGEGVIGLSRAFIYAGTKNLIISLWKVSDIATTQEMEYFYKNLLKNQNFNYSQALHNAKLNMINSHFAHPFFWSSFILIGE